MLKYFRLRKSLFSKSKRSTSSPPRSIPHDRDTDEFNPAQLDSVQKLINDSITTMSDNLMAKFSSMFDQYQFRQHNISCTSSSAVPGQSATRTEPASRLPTDRITCPAGRRFRKGHEDTVPHEDISVCDRIMDETPETPRHPPGDTGEPQDLRRPPAFVRHHHTGAGFHSQPDEDDDDDDRNSEADGAHSDKNSVRLMHSIHYRFPYSVPASAPREYPRCELWNFSHIGGYIICEAHCNFVSASGCNPRLVCGSGNTICKRVKAFTSCTAVQAQGHSGRRSTGFLFGSIC